MGGERTFTYMAESGCFGNLMINEYQHERRSKREKGKKIVRTRQQERRHLFFPSRVRERMERKNEEIREKENWVKEHIPLLIFSLSASFLHSLVERKEGRMMVKRKRKRQRID